MRALFVYQLIDVPIEDFPKRIRQISHYYRKRCADFLRFIPDSSMPITSPGRQHALRRQIDSEAAFAIRLILEPDVADYEKQKTDLENSRERLRRMREEYDVLVSEEPVAA